MYILCIAYRKASFGSASSAWSAAAPRDMADSGRETHASVARTSSSNPCVGNRSESAARAWEMTSTRKINTHMHTHVY